MKIGVFSDSHDNVNMIKEAVDLFNAEGVELVIHAGDFIAPFAVAAMSGLNCKVIGVLAIMMASVLVLLRALNRWEKYIIIWQKLW